MTVHARHLLLPLLLILSALPAHAQLTTTVKLGPVADTFVCSAPTRAAQNFGAAGALAFAPPASLKGEFQSFFRFDLAGVPASLNATFGPGAWTITAATLELWAVPPLNSIFNTPAAGPFAIDWTATDSWVEGDGIPSTPSSTGLTFNSLASALSPADRPLGSYQFSGSGGLISAPLTLESSFVADLAAGGLVGLRVFSTGASAVVNSRNFNSSPTQQPVLSITVTGPCRADLTTGAIPGQPGYGVPNGALNNDDFFYYLAAFAAGNLAVADLTTGAIASQPGYGIPNGVLNNDDFFFYLSAFAAGC